MYVLNAGVKTPVYLLTLIKGPEGPCSLRFEAVTAEANSSLSMVGPTLRKIREGWGTRP